MLLHNISKFNNQIDLIHHLHRVFERCKCVKFYTECQSILTHIYESRSLTTLRTLCRNQIK